MLNANDRTSYARAYDAFETTITGSPLSPASTAIIVRLVDAARQMAGPNPTDNYKLSAIRKAIYVAGPWNYNRAFSYDLSDPFGKIPANRLLSTYIRTRKGNCVSMPILFLIVADRMGLNVHLATAPLHMFVRYTDPQGVDHNLETTSGGHEARTEWMRSQIPMSDRAIATDDDRSDETPCRGGGEDRSGRGGVAGGEREAGSGRGVKVAGLEPMTG